MHTCMYIYIEKTGCFSLCVGSMARCHAHVLEINFIPNQIKKKIKMMITIPEPLMDKLLQSFFLTTSFVKMGRAAQLHQHVLRELHLLVLH